MTEAPTVPTLSELGTYHLCRLFTLGGPDGRATALAIAAEEGRRYTSELAERQRQPGQTGYLASLKGND